MRARAPRRDETISVDFAARLSARDWTATPLGAAESWPASLRTAVRLVLTTSHPAAIGWGPELLQLHNEAFARVIGSKRATELGGSLADLCGDLWTHIGPLAERAFRQGEAAEIEDQLFCIWRDGYAEETYLSCACTPIVDDAGGIGGVAVTVADSTGQVVGARRSTVVREVAARAVGVHSVIEACRSALDTLAAHPSDIPFALVYLQERPGGEAILKAAAGLKPGAAASPEHIELDAAADVSGWPVSIALALNETVVVADLAARFGTLPDGDWPFAPRCALVVPLTPPGRENPDGVLIAGVSARHRLDAQYRSFVELVATQVAAIIAGGRVHEAAARHAAARAAARLARARRRARMQAFKAKFAGMLEERTRLAREVHDTILQGVTGIALHLRAALPLVRSSPDAAANVLEQIVTQADRTSREARQAVWDMRPQAADEDVLRTAEAAARQLLAGTGIAIEVETAGRARRLSPVRQTAALRVVQEAVANVVRHANARTVRLRLSYERGGICVVIADDGRGFAVSEDFRSYVGHWGLVGMLERATRLGGCLTVQSRPDAGTTVALELPYRRIAQRR